ncbi:hypothetical protein AVEN_164815-1 [Araneus ventricosus]|uniref:Uncharacterized protein n=1 Tax=Araneus ventricosus TaxID=182803 RepID=A0A4Y2W3A1_ARAVE|nr:hypothetical protein AVEN_164815-1 [Araneus ventricosus]
MNTHQAASHFQSRQNPTCSSLLSSHPRFGGPGSGNAWVFSDASRHCFYRFRGCHGLACVLGLGDLGMTTAEPLWRGHITTGVVKHNQGGRRSKAI